MFRPRLELVFYQRRKLPKCDYAVRVEYFAAAMGRNGKDRPSLGEMMRSWEASPYRCGAETPELSPSIPPPRLVHLPEPCDHKAQFEELFEVYRCGNHRALLSSSVSVCNPKASDYSSPCCAFYVANYYESIP
jgi:hypothetical protein